MLIPGICILFVFLKIEITDFLYFKDLYKELWNYNSIVIIISIVLLIFLLMNYVLKRNNDMEKDLIKGKIIISVIFILFVFMNPITTKFTGKFFGFIDLQNKIWWCIPIFYIWGMSIVELSSMAKMKMLGEIVVLIMVAVIVLCNNNWGRYVNINETTYENFVESMKNFPLLSDYSNN